MTRDEMIKFIIENPYVHISHTLFDPHEFIYSGNDGIIYDESGYVFENWESVSNKWAGVNGIRLRDDAVWQNGWYVVN